MEGNDKLTVTTKPSGAVDGGRTTYGASFGADLMSFPFTDRGSNTDSSLIGVKSDVSEVLRGSELSHPEVSAREHHQTTNGNNILASDYLMNTGVSYTDYHKSEYRTNFMPVRSETATGHLTRRYGPEARNSYVSKSHISGYFSNSGHSTSMLSLAENAGVKVNNDVNGTPLRFGYPGKVDGSFLTLGIGGGMEARSGGKFSTREISSKVVEADSSQYNSYLGQQTTRNSLSLTQLTGGAARFQHELSSSTFDLVNRTSIREDGGLITGADARLSSNPLSSLQTPQADIQHNFSYNVDRNSCFQYDLAPPQLPFRSTFMSHPVGAMSSPLLSEPTGPTYLSSKPISVQPQYNYRQSSMNVPAESSTNSHIDWHRGNSLRHAQLGHLTPTFQSSVQPIGQLYSPQTVGSADAHGNSLFHERIAFPLSRGSTFQSAADRPFPKRLGVQPIDFAAARTTEGNLHQTQNSGPVDNFQKPFTPLFATGPPQVGFASRVKPLGTMVPSGQHQGHMPAQLSKDSLRVDYTKGQPIPAPKFIAQPQGSPIPHYRLLKRGANENPLDTRFGQRRRIIPQPVLHQSVPPQKQHIPVPIPSPVHMPATPLPLHVKWQGFDGHPKPSGHNCCLCKRDLSFTPEGPVSQPAVPPAVAVLPCGHTFHDHCLQIITPEDQLKDPPCIPCAIGET